MHFEYEDGMVSMYVCMCVCVFVCDRDVKEYDDGMVGILVCVCVCVCVCDQGLYMSSMKIGWSVY